MSDSNKREDYNLNIALMEPGEVVLVGTTPQEQATGALTQCIVME